MSSQAEDVTAYINLVASNYADARVQMATFALLSYEWLITLDMEIVLFWKRKKTGSTWLFLSIRYLALVAYPVLNNVTAAPMSANSCTMLQKAGSVLQGAMYLTWAAFSGLRTLALSGMNWPLGLVVFALSIGPGIADLWLVFSLGLTGEIIPLAGCAATLNGTQREAIISNLIPRGCTILADIIVLAVTLRYMFQSVGTRGKIHPGSGLAKISIVNGFAHFFVLAAINTVEITLTIISIHDSSQTDIYVSVLSDPITALLICRFLMDLQQENQKAIDWRSDETQISIRGDPDPSDTLRFASRMVGSLGGSISLDPGRSLFEDDGDDETVAMNAERSVVEGLDILEA